MKAWGENLNVDDKVLLLADENGYFTKEMGVALDLSDKPSVLYLIEVLCPSCRRWDSQSLDVGGGWCIQC